MKMLLHEKEKTEFSLINDTTDMFKPNVKTIGSLFIFVLIQMLEVTFKV